MHCGPVAVVMDPTITSALLCRCLGSPLVATLLKIGEQGVLEWPARSARLTDREEGATKITNKHSSSLLLYQVCSVQSCAETKTSFIITHHRFLCHLPYPPFGYSSSSSRLYSLYPSVISSLPFSFLTKSKSIVVTSFILNAPDELCFLKLFFFGHLLSNEL